MRSNACCDHHFAVIDSMGSKLRRCGPHSDDPSGRAASGPLAGCEEGQRPCPQRSWGRRCRRRCSRRSRRMRASYCSLAILTEPASFRKRSILGLSLPAMKRSTRIKSFFGTGNTAPDGHEIFSDAKARKLGSPNKRNLAQFDEAWICYEHTEFLVLYWHPVRRKDGDRIERDEILTNSYVLLNSAMFNTDSNVSMSAVSRPRSDSLEFFSKKPHPFLSNERSWLSSVVGASAIRS